MGDYHVHIKQVLFGNKPKTFRPKKNFQKGTKLYQLHKYAKVLVRLYQQSMPLHGHRKSQRSDNTKHLQATVKATLGAGNLQEAVLLPEGEDKNEWLAVNTVWLCVAIDIDNI